MLGVENREIQLKFCHVAHSRVVCFAQVFKRKRGDFLKSVNTKKLAHAALLRNTTVSLKRIYSKTQIPVACERHVRKLGEDKRKECLPAYSISLNTEGYVQRNLPAVSDELHPSYSFTRGDSLATT